MLKTVLGDKSVDLLATRPWEERTETKVAGRKASVTTAMVFMDALSIFAARLMFMVSVAILTFALLSRWTTTLKP